MFTKILVPVDGSPSSYRGFQQALELAKKYGAGVKVLHVVELPSFYAAPATGVAYPQNFFTGQRKFGEELLSKRAKELADQGVEGETALVEGDPSHEILAASEGCDLIVIGSRGLGRFKSLLLGSVSTKVVQYAKGPVLVVRPG